MRSRGDGYLWFQPDGTALQNRNSPSTYTNDDRYGGAEIPASATRDALPDWSEVASNGQYSWHDHRAHWMQSTRPLGKQVGDQILEGVIPLVVDDVVVDVTVISTWKSPQSKLPLVLGAVSGAGLIGLGVWRWRAQRNWALVVVPLASVALVAGGWQYLSLPAETGPRLVWWLVPMFAAVAAIVGVVAERQGRTFVCQAAALVAGVQLVVWGLIKRDGLSAALIPTAAPGWFDRLATTSALVGGVTLAGFALWTLFSGPTARTG